MSSRREAAIEIDAFDTRPEVAARCMRELMSARWRGATARPDIVVEPGAGTGTFVRAIRDALGDRVALAAFDKHREVPGLVAGGVDFLTWPPPSVSPVGVWVIGNPPFGANATDAVAFFNHAATFAELVAFIVPKCFRQVSRVRLDDRFSLRHESRLPVDAFLVGDTPYRVHTYWQVWTRREEDESERVTSLPSSIVIPDGLDARVRPLTAAELAPLGALVELGELSAALAAFRAMRGLLVARVSAHPGHVSDADVKVSHALNELKRRSATAAYAAEAWFFFRATNDADRAALAAAFTPTFAMGARGNITATECMAAFGDALFNTPTVDESARDNRTRRNE